MGVECALLGLEVVIKSEHWVCLSEVLVTAFLGSLASSRVSTQLGLNDESQLSLLGWIQLPSPANLPE